MYNKKSLSKPSTGFVVCAVFDCAGGNQSVQRVFLNKLLLASILLLIARIGASLPINRK
jgi:hypothetical protein